MESGMGIPAAIALALAVGAVTGAAQGILTTKLGFAPIIVTLGFFTGVRGIVFILNAGDMSSGFGDTFGAIGAGSLIFGVPNPVSIATALFIVAGLFHQKTKWGRYITAIGVNPEASHRAGISLFWTPFWLYVATGLGGGLGAIITVSRLDAAPPTLAELTIIDILASVLLGGVAFNGGKGNLVGVAAGVVFIGILKNGLLLAGVPPFWFRVGSGAALVLAATLDAFSRYVDRKQAGAG